MAIYHFSTKIISRSTGRSAVAAAAYRSASVLADKHLGVSHDFSEKSGVIHSQILLCDGAPERWLDRATLWNEVEARERRRDAQLAREVEFALPRELNEVAVIALARDFVQAEFVARGMVADLNVHWDFDEAGQPKPHAHVMLTMRAVEDDGFGLKVTDWNAKTELLGWRERWAAHVNCRVAELGHDIRIDHRTLKAQGIELEPQNKIGPAGMRRELRGEEADRTAEHRAIAYRNGERILVEPEIALTALTYHHSTFTRQDLARLVHRQSEGIDQFEAVTRAVEASADLVRLGLDEKGVERFTTRDMIAVEQCMEVLGDRLGEMREHRVAAVAISHALRAAAERDFHPGDDQVAALRHVTEFRDLSLMRGVAGTGKSAVLGVARDAWEASGYTVRGAALSGIAAEGLQKGSDIPSRTIASLEYAWARDRERLTASDILVLDEAGMIGSRQMTRVMEEVVRAGAKLVLVGDPEQLQAIEAGGAFSALMAHHGAAELTEIRRQHEPWQREATRALASANTGTALDRYLEAGDIHVGSTREAAKAALVEHWNADRLAAPEGSRIILAYTRADVLDLNRQAREKLDLAGQLGPQHLLQTERGERAFAVGDEVMFLRNERTFGVKNGTLGVLQEIEVTGDGPDLSTRLTVRLKEGEARSVAFELRDYAHLDYGYAATVHKSQGVTVDRAYVLATGHMDRHAAYVGLSRHRDGAELHYGRTDFARHRDLVRTLSRERIKDTTLDYVPTIDPWLSAVQGFAARREIDPAEGIHVRSAEQTVEFPTLPDGLFDGLSLPLGEPRGRNAAQVHDGLDRGMFAGLTLPAQASENPSSRMPADRLIRAVNRYAEAWLDADRMRALDLPVLPHQHAALEAAGAALAQMRDGASQDLASALHHEPAVQEAVRQLKGPERGASLVAAMERERDVRLGLCPETRAPRLVAEWRELDQSFQNLSPNRARERESGQSIETRLRDLAVEIKSDPRLEAELRTRTAEFAITQDSRMDRLLREPHVERAVDVAIGRRFSLAPDIGYGIGW